MSAEIINCGLRKNLEQDIEYRTNWEPPNMEREI